VSGIDLDTALDLPPAERILALIALADAASDPNPKLQEAMVALIEGGAGAGKDRLALGEALGALGDPRLSAPGEDRYWIEVSHDDGPVHVGRYPVTNAEFRTFVSDGGYDRAELWGQDGKLWLDQAKTKWVDMADQADSGPYVVPNQPVVGVTWFEARAYARMFEARLPRFDERLWVTRGADKRPYPWGSPFGEGNANTQEEVIGRPCAVGLFIRDTTPDGVSDLAGNVAEWNEDGVGSQRWIHPGAWDQPSMAAWAKARFLEPADSCWAGLGFRLAKD
jgi:formylglycine-generating enzyme required for sulfatase activity